MTRTPSHPGEILVHEFLEPMSLSQVALAAHLEIPVQRINEIVKGKRGVSPETAWMLSGAFGTTPEFWMNLQVNHDLARTKPKRKVKRVRMPGRPGEEGAKR